MSYPTISDDASIQAAYIAMREAGESHTIADLLAHQRGPFLMTDSVFNEGRSLRKDGYYMPSLARFSGDPEAYVSGRGDVQRIIESRPGWESTGAVKAKCPVPPAPPKEVDVAESIVREEMVKELATNPEQKLPDVREKVKNKLRPHWKKKQE